MCLKCRTIGSGNDLSPRRSLHSLQRSPRGRLLINKERKKRWKSIGGKKPISPGHPRYVCHQSKKEEESDQHLQRERSQHLRLYRRRPKENNRKTKCHLLSSQEIQSETSVCCKMSKEEDWTNYFSSPGCCTTNRKRREKVAIVDSSIRER